MSPFGCFLLNEDLVTFGPGRQGQPRSAFSLLQRTARLPCLSGLASCRTPARPPRVARRVRADARQRPPRSAEPAAQERQGPAAAASPAARYRPAARHHRPGHPVHSDRDHRGRAPRISCKATYFAYQMGPLTAAPMIVDIYLVVNEVDVHNDEFPSYPQPGNGPWRGETGRRTLEACASASALIAGTGAGTGASAGTGGRRQGQEGDGREAFARRPRTEPRAGASYRASRSAVEVAASTRRPRPGTGTHLRREHLVHSCRENLIGLSWRRFARACTQRQKRVIYVPVIGTLSYLRYLGSAIHGEPSWQVDRDY
jgi:hypothetical protein